MVDVTDAASERAALAPRRAPHLGHAPAPAAAATVALPALLGYIPVIDVAHAAARTPAADRAGYIVHTWNFDFFSAMNIILNQISYSDF